MAMKILITRPRAQANSLAAGLKAAGFEPVFFPVIEIQPLEATLELDQALRDLSNYDWVVFTSVNGVEVVLDRMTVLHLEPASCFDKGKAENPSGRVRIAAIGPKTARILEEHGLHPDFVPAEYVAEAILPGLGDLRGRKVLLPRAEIARKALPEAIVAAGGVAHEVAVYRTLPAQADPEGLDALRSGVNVVTLTSPSTVHNFVEIVHGAGLDPENLPGNPVFACIGPITRKAAEEIGLHNLVVAGEYTAEGLVQVIGKLVNP